MKFLKKIRQHTEIWYLLPGFLGFAMFYIWPFCISLGYSFLDRPVNGTFTGLKNYLELFSNSAYLQGLLNTLRFIGISVPLNMGLALLVAMMAVSFKKYRAIFSLVFLIPLVIPTGSTAFFWKSLFSYDGVLNGFITQMGGQKVNWLDSEWAFYIMILIYTWKNLGYNMILYLDGLSNIPKDYYEAAWVDGAKKHYVFRRITLPLLRPTAVLVLIMSIINSFKIFKEIYMITGNYPHESLYTLQHFMNNMFASLNYPKLTSATALLVAAIALLTQILLRMERKASL